MDHKRGCLHRHELQPKEILAEKKQEFLIYFLEFFLASNENLLTQMTHNPKTTP